MADRERRSPPAWPPRPGPAQCWCWPPTCPCSPPITCAACSPPSTPPAPTAAAAEDEGGPNPLLAAYAGPALATRAAALGAGARAGALLPADVVTVDLGRATLNVNRPEDLAAAERLAAAPGDAE